MPVCVYRCAQVRSIAYCGDAATVAFGMIGPGSHFCSHVQRCHRSNHVFFLLDFLAGVYFQKCYDPDCASGCATLRRSGAQARPRMRMGQLLVHVRAGSTRLCVGRLA